MKYRVTAPLLISAVLAMAACKPTDETPANPTAPAAPAALSYDECVDGLNATEQYPEADVRRYCARFK
jgi:hypothetical protein